MGASRKLQGEIDRVLKKVQEGVDVFDSIWNKVYDTDNANQKEKFEADLKKEIKKLQRYRDQIKTWIQSSEIKDKKVSASYEQALVDARKQIEREMERFKICEKETKTKAFSKEGLGQQPKTDPKEKAKSETRDWLNNVVGELESQIDSFEAELEGLSVKKGKAKPPRLTHLETSISRHKAHIMKLELILRLLDNDELSPEEVNDVKDFLDDYVERNQEDFDEFSDVDELYSSLSLDKVEALEELVTIVAPNLGKGSVHSLKASLAVSTSQIPAPITSTHQHHTSAQEQANDEASQDSYTDVVAGTPPAKSSIVSHSTATTPTGSLATSSAAPMPSHTLSSASAASAPLPASTSVRGLENVSGAIPSSPISMVNPAKEEDIAGFPGHRSLPSLSDAALARGIARGGLPIQSSSSMPFSSVAVSGSGAPGAVPTVSEMTKRNILGAEDRLSSSGMLQPLGSPLANRMISSQAGKADDGTSIVDSSNASDAPTIGGRVFSPSLVTGMQWRPGSSLQNPNESGQIRTRAEIAPDQREKFLQRFQQVQQQGHSNLLGIPPINGGNHKQFSAQQNPLLQQFNTQNSSASPQVNLGLGVQAPSLSTVASATLQQPNSIYQQSTQQGIMPSGAKEPDVVISKPEEHQQLQNLAEDANLESAPTPDHSKSILNEDETGASGLLGESVQAARDIDLSPGQPLLSSQPPSGLGVIGRRSVPDLGTIGDNFSAPTMSAGSMHDQLYNLQMLEAVFNKIPQPKDSELKSYVPRRPADTPSCYPQVQAPIVNNPAFWERLGLDNCGTDTFFFAFHHQQNTYQQYLAAKELKKQAWRYHKKYNTWFQRHEEPKVATDDYEQGTYVYFDYHIAEDMQHGWCQRIKHDFTFEYNYLEDELNI